MTGNIRQNKSNTKLSYFTLTLLTVTALFFNVTYRASAQDPTVVNASINSKNCIQQIDERIYSHFLEHIYNSCNGGLWGELVWNRSLEAGKTSGWSFGNGVLKQDSMDADCRFILGQELQGDSPWTDYDVRVLAKKISGREGFLVLFRVSQDGSSYYWLNLGGWDNKYVAIEKETSKSNGRHIIGGQQPIPPIEQGQTYDIRILVVGQNIKVFLNQELIHEVVDFEDDAITSGCVGVGTWNTRAEFGNVIVRDLRRRNLFELSQLGKTPQSPVDVRYWQVKGSVEARTGDARNSSRYLRYSGEGELAQQNFSFVEGETYDFSYWTRGNGNVVLGTELNDADKIEIDTYKVKSDEWVKRTGQFVVPKSSSSAIIRFQFNTTSNLDVDQISIFPRSWKEKTEGLRPDLLNAISALKPKLIRWPGGCYASAYRWKSGVGPQDDRIAYPMELWNDIDVNSFGIDEFMSLCKQVGAEPIMVVDIGTAQWINAVGDPSLKSNDWIQEVCDWVEYCNGDETTKWGAVRAKNGHKAPYNVKYWEIDNEVRSQDTPSDVYVGIINELVPKMKNIDSSISIIACGSWTGNKIKWDSEIVKGASKNFDFLSTHRYDDPNGYAVNPWENQRFFEAHRELFANSDNPNIKIFNSEWNAQSTDWRTGLHAGGFLNCCERVSDVIGIAAPALFLRHVSATAWDNAFVNFDNSRWFPAPNYVVMKLWRDSYAPNLIEMSSDSPDLNGNNPIINAVATKSQDDKTIFVKIVNNKQTNVSFHLSFDDSVKTSDITVSALTIVPPLNNNEDVKDRLRKRNTLDAPNFISEQELETKIVDDELTFTVEALSVAVVKIQRK